MRGVSMMPMYKKIFATFIVVVLLVFGGIAAGCWMQQDEKELDAADTPTQQEEIVAYVTGAVEKPGLVKLPAGSRVSDAVNAAGGLLPTADSTSVNMAKKLEDGAQVNVRSQANTTPAATQAAKGNDGRININTADEKALDELPGVGPATAKRIIEYRESNGPFAAPEDLKKVRGIGDAKFEKMKDKVAI